MSSTQPTRGVVILALGHPQYGCMAANAAASIRHSDKHTPIHLVYAGNSLAHLTPAHLNLFTSVAHSATQHITKRGRLNYLKAKTCIYQLSPFDETLMIDADLLWFGKPITGLMDELSSVDFTMQCRGYHNFQTGKTKGTYTHWCDVEEAKQIYGLTGNMYQLSSEVVWFRKTPEVKEMFSLVRKIYNNPKVKLQNKFMGDVPDELAYNIAACRLNMQPRKPHDVFIYWEFQDKNRTGVWPRVINNYYGYSIGGNNIPLPVLSKYEQMARAHAKALRLPYHFKMFPKKQWDKQRQLL